ncbi:MAG: gliding motility-associated C-terminal domain-containing protein [Crocinitomicaceae bacterium]|nr:gliding motility-associated C-terminal domain-containing protein [Crocinitomicaceae bacterium]
MKQIKEQTLNKISTSFIFLLLFYNLCTAQYNYVPNPSFEHSIDCPTMLGELSLSENWFDPTSASSDYFHSCADILSYCSIPSNLMGFQPARTGNAYAGIVTYRGSNDNFREYLCTRLLKPLTQGESYCITFYVSLADSCQYATNNIGISFSEDSLQGSIFEPLNSSSLNCEKVVFERNIWRKLVYNYHAEGNEAFLTIGNFKDYSQIQVTQVNNSSAVFDYSYYYIDDVSVYSGHCLESNYTNVFTPNNDGINDIFILDDEQDFIVFNRWGNTLFETSENLKSWNGQDNNGNNLPDGIYFFQVINSQREILFQSFVTIIR